MKNDIQWIGISKSGDNRIWGYLLDADSSYWHRTTFWGKKNGKIYFQGTRQDADFRKNLKRKYEKYKKDETLADHVLKEYEMHLLLRKLKGV
jgi:hypothetical protein